MNLNHLEKYYHWLSKKPSISEGRIDILFIEVLFFFQSTVSFPNLEESFYLGFYLGLLLQGSNQTSGVVHYQLQKDTFLGYFDSEGQYKKSLT